MLSNNDISLEDINRIVKLATEFKSDGLFMEEIKDYIHKCPLTRDFSYPLKDTSLIVDCVYVGYVAGELFTAFMYFVTNRNITDINVIKACVVFYAYGITLRKQKKGDATSSYKVVFDIDSVESYLEN